MVDDSQPVVSTPRRRFEILDAFAFRKYRQVWAASFVSQLGDWMQIFGRGVLAFQLTGDASSVGLIYFASYMPQVLLSLWAGALADRHDRRRLMLLSLVIQACGAVVVAALAATDQVTLANLAVISFVQGIGFTLMIPAMQALLPSLVPPRALHSAISFGTATNSLTRVLGPLLAALLIDTAGIEWIFIANAMTFVVIIAVWSVTTVPRQPPVTETRTRDAIRAGLRFIRVTPAVWTAMAIATMVSSIGIVYQPLSIVYATEVLAGGDEALGVTRNGWFQALLGLGAAVGILAIASWGRRRPGVMLVGTAVASSVLLVLLGWNTFYGLGLLLAVAIGAAQFGNITLAMNVVQHTTPEVLRGRVMSVLMLGLIGFVPFVSVIGGAIADAFGVGTLYVGAGLICLVFSVQAVRWRNNVPSSLGAADDETLAALGVLEEEG